MRFLYKSALGWHTLTSKNTDCSLAQKPRTRVFNRPSGALLVPLGSTSPVTSWRTGSISTSVHTAWSISASRSQISLCHCITYPPRIQLMAWSASNKSPQMHTVGMPFNSQPYFNLIASLNLLLVRVKFISFKGIMLSQLEAPFSFIKATAHWVFKGRRLVTYDSHAHCQRSLDARIAACQ